MRRFLVLLISVFGPHLAAPGWAEVRTVSVEDIQAEFLSQARGAIQQRLGGNPICPPAEVRHSAKRSSAFLQFSCSKGKGRASEKVSATVKLKSFTHGHPTISMKNWKTYGIRALDVKKGTREEWFELDLYEAQRKDRNTIWPAGNRSNVYRSTYTAELKKKFNLTYPDRPDYDATPKALRIHVEVQFSATEEGLGGRSVANDAQAIGHQIANALAFEKSEPCKHRDLSALEHPDSPRLFKLACKENFKLDLELPAGETPQSIGLYVKDEDGVTKLIRTGFETELYRRLKRRVVSREAFEAQLPIADMLNEALAAALTVKRGGDRSKPVVVNWVDLLLTAQNVTRILARPRQWFTEYPRTSAGQNRDKVDKARGIFQDLMGIASVDQYPSMLAFRRHKSFDPEVAYDPFYGPDGVLEFFRSAELNNDTYTPAHWNGGIHYYYWVGNLVQYMGEYLVPGGGGRFSGAAVFDYEFWQKKIPMNVAWYNPLNWFGTEHSDVLRAQIQLRDGFNRGVRSQAKVLDALAELQGFDPNLFVEGAR